MDCRETPRCAASAIPLLLAVVAFARAREGVSGLVLALLFARLCRMHSSALPPESEADSTVAGKGRTRPESGGVQEGRGIRPSDGTPLFLFRCVGPDGGRATGRSDWHPWARGKDTHGRDGCRGQAGHTQERETESKRHRVARRSWKQSAGKGMWGCFDRCVHGKIGEWTRTHDLDTQLGSSVLCRGSLASGWAEIEVGSPSPRGPTPWKALESLNMHASKKRRLGHFPSVRSVAVAVDALVSLSSQLAEPCMATHVSVHRPPGSERQVEFGDLDPELECSSAGYMTLLSGAASAAALSAPARQRASQRRLVGGKSPHLRPWVAPTSTGHDSGRQQDGHWHRKSGPSAAAGVR